MSELPDDPPSPPPGEPPAEGEWVYNYFNYFTEIEEKFQQARGTALFLLSPLDWALIESWKESGVPLEAVLRGIDDAFEKWRSKKSKTQAVNSLAYCAQMVLTHAQRMAAGQAAPPRKQAEAPFEIEELRQYLQRNSAALRASAEDGLVEIAESLDSLAAQAQTLHQDLEQTELRLQALEEKMVAVLRSRQTEEELLAARRELALQLRPYRGRMTAEQLSMLEKQFLERRLLETRNLPRLSLFYLH